MGKCTCAEQGGNTGTVTCLADIKDTIKGFYVPTFNSLGVRNKFLIAEDMDQDWLDDRLNDPDPSQRWRPIGVMENVSDVRAENTFETAASGRKAKLLDGIRSMSYELWDAAQSNPIYTGILESFGCTDYSIYPLDRDFNLVVTVPETEDGYAYPIRITKNSWSVNYVKAVVGASIQKNLVAYDFHPDERDKQIRQIAPSEYTCDFIGAGGLLDIEMAIVAVTATTLKVKLTNKFGTALTKGVLTGLIITDFFSAVGGTASRLFNTTTSAAITITSVVEDPDGTYLFTYVAQTAGDKIRVTPVKNGYDFTSVRATLATAV